MTVFFQGQSSGVAGMAGRVLFPVFLHWLASQIFDGVIRTVGLHADAAFLATWTAVLLLPVFLKMWQQDRRSRGETKRQKLCVASLLEIAALAVACNLVLTVIMNGLIPLFHLRNEVQEAIFSSGMMYQIFGVAVIVPIMEEVLFRGLVYGRIRDYNKGWLSVVSAAAIFALYHGNMIQILFAFPMGLIIIAVYRKWGTLAAPAAFHIAVNLSSVLISAYTGR